MIVVNKVNKFVPYSSPAVLEDVAFAVGNHSDEPSSPVKLGAGLASLAPIKVSTDCGGVVGLVESTTIEVQVSSEVKSDSALVTTPARNTRQAPSE